ncbi:MAG: hypothetical protein ACP59X_15430 [Solidesulfovibrio sp. DCME]|uniref:hypothetical protein n=1 Tax=Solidesulfovibrio sp. DCME TaxID=3447380 RepID=UPI003D11251A
MNEKKSLSWQDESCFMRRFSWAQPWRNRMENLARPWFGEKYPAWARLLAKAASFLHCQHR